MRIRLTTVATLLLGMVLATQAAAHFKLNLNVRIHHIVRHDQGAEIYLRTPMSYLVADRIGETADGGLPDPAPYTTNGLEDGMLMHLVDPVALSADPEGLGAFAAQSLQIEVGDVVLRTEVVAVRVHPLGIEPGFATREEAESALSAGPAFPRTAPETYVGDALADVHLRIRTNAPFDRYAISNSGNPGLPGQDETANLILDYGSGPVRTYRATGLMATPVEVSPSASAAAATFVIEGIRHILEGFDHVLFVICMILGAATLRSLLARVTGFTIGHTVTLILGFDGIAPQGAWFIPAVETLIAVSIILTAAEAVLHPETGRSAIFRAAGITGLIGLLHGFGFSFMLQNILRVDAPNVWQSLLAFNIGVEVGQLMIVAVAWPVVVYLRARPGPTWKIASIGTAGLAAFIATGWVIERVGGVWA
ncbi:HupE/UreJ family protein [Halovulum sp. GXIMD14794]